MALSFDLETPVLSYGPQAHVKAGRRNDRAWLLWPAVAFRVVAPRFEERRINALQQAVLGVLRSSRLTAGELGERLGVDPELAAFVVGELQGQRWVDETWQVTERGLELLEQQREAATSLVPGWVFRDPHSGRLWPFVAPTLELARSSRDERGYPVLELGTTGKPWQQSPWLQWPKLPVDDQPPTAREIASAAVIRARLERRARRQPTWHEPEDEALPEIGRVDLRRVVMIEDQATPVFLTTFLYLPHDRTDDVDWYACDLFGRGSAPVLRQLIFEIARADDKLARVIDRMLDRVLGQSFEDLRRAADAIASRARDVLDRALGTRVQASELDRALVSVVEGLLELRELGDGTELRRRRGAIVACRVATEQLLRTLAHDWPVAGISDALGDDPELNGAVIRGAAVELGLAQPPHAMCNIRRNQVRSVADYSSSASLRALAVATLLRACEQAEHPLRRAATLAPRLLDEIEFIADVAGGAAHADGQQTVEVARAEEVVQRCLELVGHIHGLSIRPIEELLRSG